MWAKRYDAKRTAPMPSACRRTGHAGFTLQPAEAVTESSIYTGPKDLKELRKMKGHQDKVMNFGMFGITQRAPALGHANGLQSIFHSFAAAIIVLTLIIKSLLWPVQNKATNEMRKMAALSPKMTEMREKFRDDPQKLERRDDEVVPRVWGESLQRLLCRCLIQIPIFFGFYAMLGSAIELRNSSVLWVQDLSPARHDRSHSLFNFPINLSPIVMAGMMVWQMIISPKSGDAVQQRMYSLHARHLPRCFSYNYASGLALYWTTQKIFSLSSSWYRRGTTLPTLEKRA